MTLFDLPLICILLALSPPYNYYYAGDDDTNSDCVLRLMMFLKTEKNSFNYYSKPIIEYSKIPKRKRPLQSNAFGYPPRRKWR